MKFIVKTEKQTVDFANKFSKVVKPPLIIGISGELGVGKTSFIRNLIKTYKNNERVKSPTFSIVEEYEYNDIKIVHADLYRINKNERNYIDFNSYYSDDCLILIEWIENDLKLMRNSDIIININILGKKDSREIKLVGNSLNGKKLIKKIKNDF